MSDTGPVAFRDIGAEFVPRPRARVVSEVVDDIAVLYDEAMGLCHRLNATATVIWLQLDGRSNVASIADAVATRFRGDEHRIRAEVLALVQHFGELGLLEGVTSRSEELFVDDRDHP